MHSYLTFIALDIAAQRTREADQDRLAALVRSGQPPRRPIGSVIRQPLAAVLSTLSRASAAAARKLEPTRS
jgi:hypothetical protein